MCYVLLICFLSQIFKFRIIKKTTENLEQTGNAEEKLKKIGNKQKLENGTFFLFMFILRQVFFFIKNLSIKLILVNLFQDFVVF